ncbi:uncharacterized protein LOC106646674 [Copidosoma floridanum]|uniref:uncharacterized protein LOC106646674 n=1 Tax=Copidosoma floridanum TaxID=29053 RepID=UPI0006C9B475|nr:uncharacterized protein LOC106646674 [Copidosoma floridanum]
MYHQRPRFDTLECASWWGPTESATKTTGVPEKSGNVCREVDQLFSYYRDKEDEVKASRFLNKDRLETTSSIINMKVVVKTPASAYDHYRCDPWWYAQTKYKIHPYEHLHRQVHPFYEIIFDDYHLNLKIAADKKGDTGFRCTCKASLSPFELCFCLNPDRLVNRRQSHAISRRY